MERKVRTPEGSEPANGGAPERSRSQISNLESQIGEWLRRRQVQQRIDQPAQSDFEISNLSARVMGETVRPVRATEISDLRSQK